MSLGSIIAWMVVRAAHDAVDLRLVGILVAPQHDRDRLRVIVEASMELHSELFEAAYCEP